MESGFNIIEEQLIDVSVNDFESDQPFFFHCLGDGDISYLPWGNKSNNVITKSMAASDSYNCSVQCRKIFSSGTTATNIYIGYPR